MSPRKILWDRGTILHCLATLIAVRALSPKESKKNFNIFLIIIQDIIDGKYYITGNHDGLNACHLELLNN